jgi:ketosteroid isomerase-like protein
METKVSKATNEAQIRERLDNWARAVRDKDLEGLMSHYAPDIRLFDLAPPAAVHWHRFLSKELGGVVPELSRPMGYEINELRITSGDDTAFSHSLNHISGTRTDGEQTDVWVRATVGFHKRDDKWMITHEHYSVPFYMKPPYKASLDLKP